MAETELKIVIKTIDQSTPAVNQMEATFNKLAKTVISLATVKVGFDFLKDSINKAAAEEKNLRTLQTVIENQGGSWDAVRTKVEQYILSLERSTMYSDEQLIPSMRQLINAGMDTEQAMQAMGNVMDLATAKGIDLETSANLVGKAYMGNTTLLGRYGIQAKDFNGLMDQINTKFGGAARKDMDSYAGNVRQLEQAIDENQKMIGNYWIPALIEADKWLVKVLGLGNMEAAKTYNETMYKAFADGLIKLKHQLYEADTKEEEARINKLIKTQTDMMNKFSQAATEEKNKPAAGTKNGVLYTPSDLEQDEKNMQNWLKYQNSATKQLAENYDRMWTDISDSGKLEYDLELELIDTKAAAYRALGIEQNDIDEWVANEKMKLLAKEFSLQEKTYNAVEVLATGSADEQKYLLADMLEAEALVWAKKFAWLAVWKLLNLDFVGAAVAAAEAVALGYAASAIHQETERDKALNKTTDSATATDYTSDTSTSTASTGSSAVSSNPSTIESSPSPTYYYINNQYVIQAGVMLGSRDEIDKAFNELMKRYDMQTSLVRSA